VPLSDLSLRHLAALRAVVEQGSFRRAADALGYSQAAVTQQIAGLERAVGLPVFHRPGGPRPVTLTAAGREVLEAGRDVLGRVGLLEARVAGLADGTLGRLSVGTFQSVSAHLLPQLLAEIRGTDSQVAVTVMESDDNDVLVAGLLSGRLDVSFLVGPVRDDRLAIEEVCRDPFVAMDPADGAAGAVGAAGAGADGDDVVRLADLHGRPAIGHQACACHEIVEAGLGAAGIAPDFVFRSNDNAAVQAMVRAGIGTAIMPLLAISADDPRVRVRRLHPALPARPILVAVPRDRVERTAERFVRRALELGATLSDAARRYAGDGEHA
jgi:DNA-binding transcriptional LysR family regulator